MRKTVSIAIQGYLLLFALHALAGPVPDTGQTKCYNDTEEIACPQPGEPFYGQDANYTINPPSYTKLDAGGNDLPDEAADWSLVRDNVTGLTWEVKTDDGSVHDKDNTYTWCDGNSATNGGDAGTCGSGTDTEDFIDELNAEEHGGFSDWRLPTREELRSIADYGRSNPAIDTVFFPFTVSPIYWSSTTRASNADYAWLVIFYYGDGLLDNKSNSYHVRAVRGGQTRSLDHFVIDADGTVTDTSTGRMWQQATAPNTMNWRDALSYCEGLALGEHDDWRLPNIKELASLADLDEWAPAIDTTFFPDTVSSLYWSSTTADSYTDYAWIVGFPSGNGNYFYKSNSYYVRAVRGGQSVALGDLEVLYPKGGESLSKGTDYTITWNSASIAGNIQIDLYKGGIEPEDMLIQLAPATENDGEYPFDPGDNATIADGEDYYIGISAENGTVWDFSNVAFSIQTDTDGDGTGNNADADDDNDGVDDTVDNCPIDTNADQDDFDDDGLGDACDADVDGDVVPNDEDECELTPLDVAVDPGNGCSIHQLCPSEGPRGTTESWRNHGKYVSCVAHAAENLLELGLIAEEEKDAIVSEAGQSDIGKKTKPAGESKKKGKSK